MGASTHLACFWSRFDWRVQCTPKALWPMERRFPGRTRLVRALHLFFARVEALCVQVVHKSPLASKGERYEPSNQPRRTKQHPKTQHKPDQKRRQGSYLKKAETAEEAVRQSETRGNEFSLGTQYMTFLSFHVFFYVSSAGRS